jgi:hypothetical protein
MKNFAKVSALTLLALCVAGTSWAGGANCSPEGVKAKEASAAGAHCGTKASTASKVADCGVKANQVMYSFAVPSVDCEKCIESIQKAAMASTGIHCAHVDLSTHTAYIIADKSLSQKEISKLIADAGYKNKYSAKGEKAQAAFAKAMASGDNGMNNCCAKGKDKA